MAAIGDDWERKLDAAPLAAGQPPSRLMISNVIPRAN